MCDTVSYMYLSFDAKKLEGVAKKFDLKFVILHGSYATGRVRTGSDFDVAVLGNHPLSPEAFFDLYGALADVFGDNSARELDLKTLHHVDPLFRYEVTRAGQLLYGDPTAYEEFKAFAHRAYDDAEPLFDLEYKLIKKNQQYLNKALAEYF